MDFAEYAQGTALRRRSERRSPTPDPGRVAQRIHIPTAVDDSHDTGKRVCHHPYVGLARGFHYRSHLFSRQERQLDK
jgi:hypothetical protein